MARRSSWPIATRPGPSAVAAGLAGARAHAIDLADTAACRAMVADVRRAPRTARHPGQRGRLPAHRAGGRLPDGALGRDPARRCSRRRSSSSRPRLPAMYRARLGPDRQHRLHPFGRGLAEQGRLCRRQARAAGPDPRRRDRGRRPRGDLQRGLPGLRPDAAGRGADRRPGARRPASRSRRSWTGSCSPAPSIPRLLEADEVAAYVRFLCSDAAGGITGSAQMIDGGWTAR